MECGEEGDGTLGRGNEDFLKKHINNKTPTHNSQFISNRSNAYLLTSCSCLESAVQRIHASLVASGPRRHEGNKPEQGSALPSSLACARPKVRV